MTDRMATLAGRGILITRPAAQAAGLAARVAASGGLPILFPAIEIAAPTDTAALSRAIDELPDHDLAIFISPTSVERAWPLILERHRGWPGPVTPAAVGPASARGLAGCGVDNVLTADDGADSESLLALDVFQQVRGKRILIVRGEGGRELLADTLRERGATVDYAECYRRVRPDADAAPLLQRWRSGDIAAVTVTSREVFANLVNLLGEAGAPLLKQTPLFAPHPRIAEAASAWGVVDTIAAPPGDAGLVSAMLDWFNRPHD
jgi:uroporphyrinogen-III synthase